MLARALHFGLGTVGGVLRPIRLIRRIVTAVLVAYVGGTFVQVWWAANQDEARPVQAIVVLGAAQYDGQPSPVLRARLDHALELYEHDIAPLVIVTGGRQPGDRTTEASAAARYLARHGIPDSRIRREVQGRSTWESLAAVSRFLHREGIDEVVLVTNSYHAKRARATAAEVGLRARSSPVGGSPFSRLVRETGAVAVGRIIGYRRLTSIV